MTHIGFAILNSHVKVRYLRFNKSTNFLFGKTEKLKTAVLFPAIYPCMQYVFFKQESY